MQLLWAVSVLPAPAVNCALANGAPLDRVFAPSGSLVICSELAFADVFCFCAVPAPAVNWPLANGTGVVVAGVAATDAGTVSGVLASPSAPGTNYTGGFLTLAGAQQVPQRRVAHTMALSFLALLRPAFRASGQLMAAEDKGWCASSKLVVRYTDTLGAVLLTPILHSSKTLCRSLCESLKSRSRRFSRCIPRPIVSRAQITAPLSAPSLGFSATLWFRTGGAFAGLLSLSDHAGGAEALAVAVVNGSLSAELASGTQSSGYPGVASENITAPAADFPAAGHGIS